MAKRVELFMGPKGQACEHAFVDFNSKPAQESGLCDACVAGVKKKEIDLVATWFRGEFRHVIIDPGKVVAFVPSTEDGKQRNGVMVRVHNAEYAQLAGKWLEGDRIFFYQLMDTDGADGGYFNERTRDRISVSR